jgi:hypothetical protein
MAAPISLQSYKIQPLCIHNGCNWRKRPGQVGGLLDAGRSNRGTGSAIRAEFQREAVEQRRSLSRLLLSPTVERDPELIEHKDVFGVVVQALGGFESTWRQSPTDWLALGRSPLVESLPARGILSTFVGI